jgi:solute carrier family 6 GABA transporter-like protein 6/8/11/12/13
MVETVITALEDEFNVHIKKFIKKREILVLVVCAFLFFLSLPNICPVNMIPF